MIHEIVVFKVVRHNSSVVVTHRQKMLVLILRRMLYWDADKYRNLLLLHID